MNNKRKLEFNNIDNVKRQKILIDNTKKRKIRHDDSIINPKRYKYSINIDKTQKRKIRHDDSMINPKRYKFGVNIDATHKSCETNINKSAFFMPYIK